MIRLPESAVELPIEALTIEPEDIDELVVETLPQTALFSARFRECAGRALLLPRRRPDRRTPLWQQRQRSAQLLQIAAEHPTFPIVLEAFREILQDDFDVPALQEDGLFDMAVGRVAAREFIASHGLPPFDHSAKDGFAVRSVDTRGATRESRVELSVVTTIPAGTMPEVELRAGQAAKIMTGAPLPSGADGESVLG